MKTYKTFETDRLLLRPTGIEDADFIFELVNTPKWLKFIGQRNIKSPADAIVFISEKMLPQLERLGYGNYTVINKLDGSKMGTCGLYDREGIDGLDIGFAFLPKYEKQGFAFESSKALLDAAFNDFSITKMSAITAKRNTASQRLLEKLGLKFIELIKLSDEGEELKYYVLEL